MSGLQRVADYIIEKLHSEGIDKIFLITGRGILYLTDAVAKEEGFDGICTYHEQGASYAAMAYAQARDGLGACLVSTGCAATNAVTAALCAWQDNVPVVFVSGQHMLQETTRYTGVPIRSFGSQEADIIEVVKPVTKYAVMLTNPQQVALEMEKAIYLAQEGRQGPVWIDVPLDVQNMRIEPETLPHFVPQAEKNDMKELAQQVRLAAEELNRAERPVLLIGGGVRSAGAIEEIAALVEKTRVPLVYTPSAADVYGAANDLSIGALGSIGGSRAGNFTVQNADHILAIGTKLCSQATGGDDAAFAREATLTVVDIDPMEHTKPGVSIDRVIVADAKDFLKELLQVSVETAQEAWTAKCLHWKETFALREEDFIRAQIECNENDLYALADVLTRTLPQRATVITDAGFEELIVPSSIRYRSGQRCLFPAAQGAMGYAVPAVLGAHFAGREDIVVVVGDGSVMMNIQELQAIAFHKIPAKIIVVNNNMYAVIRERQRMLFRKRTIGNDPGDGLGAPDFEKLSQGFGITYQRIEGSDQLEKGLQQLFATPGAVLCEVMCTSEQKFFHMSYGMNEQRRLERRPLEDLSPFIDRARLKEEMIVEPMGGKTK